MDAPNPYEPPNSLAVDDTLKEGVPGRGIRRLQIAWLVVFLLNLPIPLLFGWSLTEHSGRVGMVMAALLLLILGCWVCAALRKVGRLLVVGGALMGPTQFVPVFQVAAGMMALAIGKAAGQVRVDHDGLPGNVSSEVGGVLVTSTTGALLIAASLGLGLFLRLITPGHWWVGRAEDA